MKNEQIENGSTSAASALEIHPTRGEKNTWSEEKVNICAYALQETITNEAGIRTSKAVAIQVEGLTMDKTERRLQGLRKKRSVFRLYKISSADEVTKLITTLQDLRKEIWGQ